ncbi:DDE-type integrase/transposase/recombinase [Mesorhizobium sp. M6A.T.Ce.TU.016.01.1.1]|uniref:DDE-type integrase/transposase/recombinase n=1 Tax=Mesorhizobium sp. M6A.T.Ce.TU.016.01.1.1 TaxID=2496783 RepID=UPI000FC9B18A|nr:DDE-type integrase/transposase/recombinase [Mesorhizobium sp. M6A.T.Ce.TU.016.01.1.1]RUU25955.1 hypothetical protein EOC94_29450 [Mesorhizobium sp. M6A.T.Ce.TU.016.01.1.1]
MSPVRFVYVAIILDVWSRMIVGYAISRAIDARLTGAALRAAIERRKPPPGCVHHSDRGSQYAAETYRQLLTSHGLAGSMGRKGNPCDNAKAESFMKTLKLEAVYPMALETLEEVAEHLPDFIAAVFALHGNMTNCLVYGPVAGHIHAIDGRVCLPSLLRVTKAIALFAADWCGVEARANQE